MDSSPAEAAPRRPWPSLWAAALVSLVAQLALCQFFSFGRDVPYTIDINPSNIWKYTYHFPPRGEFLTLNWFGLANLPPTLNPLQLRGGAPAALALLHRLCAAHCHGSAPGHDRLPARARPAAARRALRRHRLRVAGRSPSLRFPGPLRVHHHVAVLRACRLGRAAHRAPRRLRADRRRELRHDDRAPARPRVDRQPPHRGALPRARAAPPPAGRRHPARARALRRRRASGLVRRVPRAFPELYHRRETWRRHRSRQGLRLCHAIQPGPHGNAFLSRARLLRLDQQPPHRPLLGLDRPDARIRRHAAGHAQPQPRHQHDRHGRQRARAARQRAPASRRAPLFRHHGHRRNLARLARSRRRSARRHRPLRAPRSKARCGDRRAVGHLHRSPAFLRPPACAPRLRRAPALLGLSHPRSTGRSSRCRSWTSGATRSSGSGFSTSPLSPSPPTARRILSARSPPRPPCATRSISSSPSPRASCSSSFSAAIPWPFSSPSSWTARTSLPRSRRSCTRSTFRSPSPSDSARCSGSAWPARATATACKRGTSSTRCCAGAGSARSRPSIAPPRSASASACSPPCSSAGSPRRFIVPFSLARLTATNPLLDSLASEGPLVRVAVPQPQDSLLNFYLQNQFAALRISSIDISAASRIPDALTAFVGAFAGHTARLWLIGGVKNVAIGQADLANLREDPEIAANIVEAGGFTLTASPDGQPTHALVRLRDYFNKATFIPSAQLGTDAENLKTLGDTAWNPRSSVLLASRPGAAPPAYVAPPGHPAAARPEIGIEITRYSPPRHRPPSRALARRLRPHQRPVRPRLAGPGQRPPRPAPARRLPPARRGSSARRKHGHPPLRRPLPVRPPAPRHPHQRRQRPGHAPRLRGRRLSHSPRAADENPARPLSHIQARRLGPSHARSVPNYNLGTRGRGTRMRFSNSACTRAGAS